MGVDPTPAPLGDVSIGAAIEAFTGARFGSSGTLTASRIITAAVKAVPKTDWLLRPDGTGDGGQAPRAALGGSHLQCRFAAGLFLCVRNRTGHDSASRRCNRRSDWRESIADVASLATKWNKPLSARLQPIPGKKPARQPNLRTRTCSTPSCMRCLDPDHTKSSNNFVTIIAGKLIVHF